MGVFRTLPLLLLLIFVAPALADPSSPDCPEGKVIPSSPSPAPSQPSSPSSMETTDTKNQIGLTFDPPTIPDKPLVEEKNPERKRLLDKIFEVQTKEAAIQVRLDELARLRKDCDERIQKTFDDNKKLLDDLHAVIEKKSRVSIFRSLDSLDKESDRIWREIGINGAIRDKQEEQEQRLHDERLSLIDEEGRTIIQRTILEEWLDRMDVAQKKASQNDAERASLPKPGR